MEITRIMNIRKYFLITDTHKENPNPGDIMIGNGIEYLLREAELRLGNLPIFRYVSIFDIDGRIWNDVFREADYIVVCGTPQLGYSPSNHFDKIYMMIQKAKAENIITANLGMGAGGVDQNYNIDKNANEIYEIHRDRKLRYMSYFDLITTRDEIITKVLETNKSECYKFIDTVFYAANYFNINKQVGSFNIVTLKLVASNMIDKIMRVVNNFKFNNILPITYLCHDLSDFECYKDLIKDLICVNDPSSLIKLYSHGNQVLSMKIHGSVPALNFGLEVVNICMDCRSNILEQVGVQSVKLDEFINGRECKFQHIPQIDELKEYEKERFIKLWFEKCQSKIERTK
jgi:hypothetical protein